MIGSSQPRLAVAPAQAASMELSESANNWPSRPEAISASPWEGLYDSSQLTSP